MRKMSRRNFVKTMAVSSATLMAPVGVLAMTPMKNKQTFPRSFSTSSSDFYFVHLTDQHVRSKRMGDKGYKKCIESVNALKPCPELVLMGGDLAFDGNYTDKEEFIRQIDLYKTITEDLKMPYYNSIGNHDVLGWSSRRKVPVDDPDLGKKLFMDKLGMKKSYYSIDHKGWHFVILDSIYPIDTDSGPSYEPRIGKEQLEWLADDLGTNHGKPIVVVTHIAAFYNINTVNGDPEAKAMSPGMVLKDTKELRLLFERHNVIALLQGHSHTTEDFKFNGVNYLTSPAVSAAWWGGNWLGFKPGYTVFHCKGKELTWERKTYEWEYQLEPEDTLEKKKNTEWDAFLKEQKELMEKEIETGKGLQKVS